MLEAAGVWQRGYTRFTRSRRPDVFCSRIQQAVRTPFHAASTPFRAAYACPVATFAYTCRMDRIPFGVYERKGSPFWWIWHGHRDDRKQESSGKRRSNPVGWKQAYDLARLRAGAAEGGVSGDESRWDAWVEDWLRVLLPNPENAGSLVTAKMHWKFIRAWLGSRSLLDPAGVTYAVAMEYFAWRQKNRRHQDRPKVQTATIEMKLLRRVLGEAVRREFIPKNPLAELKLAKPIPKEKPEITAEEEVTIRSALAAREGHLPWKERWMTVSFLFGIRHGWRINETSAPLDRVRFDSWEVLVRSKGNKWRTVPVHPELRPILADVKASGQKRSCAFPNNDVKAASRAWSLFFRGSARDKIKGLFPHLCHHCGRVTVISRLARAGVPERLVMEFVGHWSITSHRIYSRVAHGDLQRCIFPDAPATSGPPSPSP